MQSTRTYLWLPGLLVALSACADLTGAAGKRRPGILQWERGGASRSSAVLASMAPSDPAVVTAPDTVRAGESFQAVVTTIGPDGCWREAGAETKLTASLAILTPYDMNLRDLNRELGCKDSLITLPRTVQIRFSERGEATLRVHGRKIVGGDPNQQGTPMTVEKKIVVR
jgi:hypothetical protein